MALPPSQKSFRGLLFVSDLILVSRPIRPAFALDARKDIQSLQRAGISTLPAEALLARMQATVDNLCAERDKRVG
jgi:hypothetical protein